jgi:hypothetical protein
MNNAIRGNKKEEDYVRELNKNSFYWENICFDKKGCFAIHVTRKVYGYINETKVFPKADLYLAKGQITTEYLENVDFYLTEKDVPKFNLVPIQKSGISVKLPNSKYTICKISPGTFFKLFNSNILAAGSSVYCNNQNEIYKNKSVLRGWMVENDSFINYFKDALFKEDLNINDLTKLREIKKFSNEEISKLIQNSEKLKNFIFKGNGNFPQPYTAEYIIEDDALRRNYIIPFSVTTGSGRSKGTFTIVIKPRN